MTLDGKYAKPNMSLVLPKLSEPPVAQTCRTVQNEEEKVQGPGFWD